MRSRPESVGDFNATSDRRDFTLRALGRRLTALITHTDAAERWIEANADSDHFEEWRIGGVGPRTLFMESDYAVALMNGIVEAGLRIACNC